MTPVVFLVLRSFDVWSSAVEDVPRRADQPELAQRRRFKPWLVGREFVDGLSALLRGGVEVAGGGAGSVWRRVAWMSGVGTPAVLSQLAMEWRRPWMVTR